MSPTANIRTTIISPGDVAIELSNTITDQDVRESLKTKPFTVMAGVDVVNAIIYAMEQPEYVSVNEILIRPTLQQS